MFAGCLAGQAETELGIGQAVWITMIHENITAWLGLGGEESRALW
jgi:hypothetical protein